MRADHPGVEAAWPAELDGPVAAPMHHVVLFENEHVRMVETVIPPGDRTPVHTHARPGAIYWVSGSDFVRRDPDGTVAFDSRGADPPSRFERAEWMPAVGPHSLENVGGHVLHNILFEFKDTASA